MFAALLMYVCATQAMDDCHVYVERTWRGPTAMVECQRELARIKRPPLLYVQRGGYVRYVCDSQTVGE